MAKANIEIGSSIAIPCKATTGAFAGEYSVEFDTLDGKVSGFAQKANIQEKGGRYFIKGVVVDLQGDILTAMVEGSFFTTNGLATMHPNEVEPLAMAA